MAIYRCVQTSFWNDIKIADEFTPEDKYFYLYLLTNPKTNLCGCYELSIRQASVDTGYTKETIGKLIDRFEKVLKVILYSRETKEVLLLHWYRYNWTKSAKFKTGLMKHIKSVKTPVYKQYLEDLFNGIDSVSIPYLYGMDTSVTVTVTDTDTVTDTVTDAELEKKPKRYGEYNHVILTDDQYKKLVTDYGEAAVLDGIRNVDEYCEEKGKTYKNYNLTLRKWGIKAKPIPQKPQSKVVDPEEEARQKAWEEGFHDA